MSAKMKIFLEIAGKLSKNFDIIPVLYGSLGLSLALQEDLPINDIDILVPDEYLEERWADLSQAISNLGFELVDLREHEFIRAGEKIAFAKYQTLRDIGLTAADLPETEINGIKFKLPASGQFLEIYKYSQADGYRRDKRNDAEKIRLLEKHIH